MSLQEVVSLLVMCLANGLFGYLLGMRRRPHAEHGLPIKLRHQNDVARFVVGQVVTIDETLLVAFDGAWLAGGTIETDLVVTWCDWPNGTIWVAPKRSASVKVSAGEWTAPYDGRGLVQP